MWMFLFRRLRVWVLLSIALPLARALVHRLALAADHRDPSARSARALRQADSAVTAVSRRASRRGAVVRVTPQAPDFYDVGGAWARNG
jgi:hypothetical protein